MRTKFTKTDTVFLFALSAGVLMQLVMLLCFPFSSDESFYLTIPLRLLQGESLFAQEWHLSQLSSVFTFLPVYSYVQITGSTDGLLLFSRCIYLCLYTAVAAVTYLTLRKYGKWAIAAVLLFFTQTPYRILAISYNSVFAIGILLLTLCLISLPHKAVAKTAFAGGLCIGCCCICNPLFFGAYGVYLVVCLFRKKTAKPDVECYFCNKTVLFSLLGTAIPAVVTLVFVLCTGTTVASALSNLPLLLQSSEYGLGLHSTLQKLLHTVKAFHNISLHTSFLLPVFYLAMVLDRKRCTLTHRCVYLLLAMLAGGVYIVGIVRSVITNTNWPASLFFSLPLLIFTTTCYILTENKNKFLFYRMWLPCAAAAFVQYLAANTMLSALGFVFAIANIAGVVFAGQLYREMKKQSDKSKPRRSDGQRLICAGLCLQLLFQLFVCSFGQLPTGTATRLTTGPCAGLYASEKQTSNYQKTLNDLDYLKSLCREDTPVLIVSYSGWMYLYLNQPVAAHTTWFDGAIDPQTLRTYYRHNPDHTPRYIYIDSLLYDGCKANLKLSEELFTFTARELSQGILLTVEVCK